MSALSTSLVLPVNPRVQLPPGSSLNQFMGSVCAVNLLYSPSCTRNLQLSTSRRSFLVKARDGERPGAASIFVGGFVPGGDDVGAHDLLCKAVIGEEKEIEDEETEDEEHETANEDEETEDEETEDEEQETELDEEKLEKRKLVADMIADINSALDTVVDRIHRDLDYDPNEVYLDLDEEEYGTFVGPDEYQTII